jgi:hypothetical protein
VTPVEYVSDRTGGKRQQEEWQCRSGLDQSDVDRTAGQRGHQPRRSHGLHECSDVGYQVSDQEVTENRDAERAPGAKRRRWITLRGVRHRALNLHQYRNTEKIFTTIHRLAGGGLEKLETTNDISGVENQRALKAVKSRSN